MLEELNISNLGLIESLQVHFVDGFNVITGETGVGKSMLLGALNFILGARANSDLIRFGEAQAMVTGVFHLKSELFSRVREEFPDAILDSTLYIRRVITREGRSKSYINDVPVTLNVLKVIASLLVEVHGQHEHQSLMRKEVQTQLLDRFGRSDTLYQQYRDILNAAREKKKQLDNYGFNQKKRQEEAEYLEYQLKEHEEVSPKKGELTQLEKDIKFASNYQKIATLLTKADSLLNQENSGASSQLFSLQKTIAQLELLDTSFSEIGKQVAVASELISSLSDLIVGKMQTDVFSSGDVDKMISRAEKIKKLYQKHNIVCGEEIDFFKKMRAKLAELKQSMEKPDELANEIASLSKKLFAIGEELSSARMKSAKKMEKLIEQELKDLGMPDAKIQVLIQRKITKPNEILSQQSTYGLDEIEFMFLPNLGAPYMPLRDIASGGELARTMLSVAKTLSDVDQTALLVFDEIDANIGGRLGSEIGTKIAQVAKEHQVICVTHLPQIAAYAEKQFKISKNVVDGQTKTTIKEIDGELRLKELAEMMQGKNYNETTLKQASELLTKAQNQLK